MRTPSVWLVSNGDYWKAVWNSPTGRKSKSLGSKSDLTRRQANVLCRQLAADQFTLQRFVDAPSLGEWIDQLLRSRSDLKTASLEKLRGTGLYLRLHFTESARIDSITRPAASDWLDALISGELAEKSNEHERRLAVSERRSPRKPVAKPKLATVRSHVRSAKIIFNEAARRDLIPFNPFDRLPSTPPAPHKTWRDITQADLAQILAACPSTDWRCLFSLCRLAGLRLGEALRLEWSDVRFPENRLFINSGIDVETTKQRYRVCPIEPERVPTGLTQTLADAQKPKRSGRVCNLGLNNLRRTALAILKRSGVGEYARPFHTLRKCWATQLALHYPQGIVSEWLGHDEAVSRRIYQRVPDELYAPPPGIGHDFGHSARPNAKTPMTRRQPASDQQDRRSER